MLEKLARIAETLESTPTRFYGGLDRREFFHIIRDGAITIAGASFPPESAEAYVEGRDLAARIKAFRNRQEYPSVLEYAASLGIQPLASDPEISQFIKRQDIVTHIKKVSIEYNIPSYLLAAIVAEERTFTDSRDRILHQRGEYIKSTLGYDTSIGIANVNMSIGAYYTGKIRKPSKMEFDALSQKDKEEVRKFLENEQNNLEVAGVYLRDLKRKFLGWNEANMEKAEKITSREIDANPLALLQIANGYSGGEDMLHRKATEKAKRVIAMLTGNQFIWDLYDGKKYFEKLQQLRAAKEVDGFYNRKLLDVQRFLSDGIDLRAAKKFGDGYKSLVDAVKTASDSIIYAKSKNSADWEIIFMSYAAYANASAGKLLVNAREYQIRGVPEDKKRALAHYQTTLDIYKSLESRKVDISSIKVKPKPTWEKKLPPKKDIEDVIRMIKEWM